MLSKEKQERIEGAANAYSESFKTGRFFEDIRKSAFIIAATAEANRAQILEEA